MVSEGLEQTLQRPGTDLEHRLALSFANWWDSLLDGIPQLSQMHSTDEDVGIQWLSAY